MPGHRPDSTSGFHSRLENLIQDPNFAVATLDNYVLLVWRREVSVAGGQALTEVFARMRARRPQQKLGFITIITETTVHSASSEVRQLVARALKTYEPNIGAAAISYELDGFWSAITRSVITAINIASRATFPSEVFGDEQEAIAFVTRELRDSSEVRWQVVRAALDVLRGSTQTREELG